MRVLDTRGVEGRQATRAMSTLQQLAHWGGLSLRPRPCHTSRRCSDAGIFPVQCASRSKQINCRARAPGGGHPSPVDTSGRLCRRSFSCSLILSFASLLPAPWQTSYAAEEAAASKESLGTTVLDSVLSFFDSEEATKSGRKLPKSYLQNAREVVKTLRSSVDAEYTDAATFRRNADSAKEAIRNYVQNWRGDKAMAKEESYLAIERVLRVLGTFYQKKGPNAQLSQDVKSRILDDLSIADAAL